MPRASAFPAEFEDEEENLTPYTKTCTYLYAEATLINTAATIACDTAFSSILHSVQSKFAIALPPSKISNPLLANIIPIRSKCGVSRSPLSASDI